MILNDAFSLFYFPIFFFAFMQFRNLFTSPGFYSFNSFITLLLMIVAAILPIAWTFMWKTKSQEEVANRLWFLTIRVKPVKSDGDLALVHDEKSQEQIK